MLKIVIPAAEDEYWDEVKQEFIYTEHSKEVTLQLEHSLVSLSKWESKWEKPFLTKNAKTYEESIDYIKCMTITQNVPDEVYSRITDDMLREIWAYIEKPMTATTVHERETGKINNEQITAELVYYWMIALQIPVEFQKWHFNKLMTLIRVCNVKNQPPKKMSLNEIYSRNAALNKARREAMNSKG